MRQDPQSHGRYFRFWRSVVLAILNVSQCAESVDLQLEDVTVGVERFSTAGKPYGT
jgi:hypothetical protein